jgi:hypothetical protein
MNTRADTVRHGSCRGTSPVSTSAATLTKTPPDMGDNEPAARQSRNPRRRIARLGEGSSRKLAERSGWPPSSRAGPARRRDICGDGGRAGSAEMTGPITALRAALGLSASSSDPPARPKPCCRSEPGRARLQSHRNLTSPFEVHRLNLQVLRSRIKVPEAALNSVCLIDGRPARSIIDDLDGFFGR